MSWTEAEIAQVRELYAKGGRAAVRAAFPDLSANALNGRMTRIGCKARTYVSWTTFEVQRLRKLYRDRASIADIAREIGRTTSSVRMKVQELGLPAQYVRKWTHGQRKVVDQSVDNLICALAQRLGRTPASIHNAITMSLVTRNKRKRSNADAIVRAAM